jgi:hypothetical protein
MTEILIDPAELEQSASWLRNVTGQLAELSDLGAVCCCEMPPGIGAYVDTELGSAGAMVGEAASGYGIAADDLATRSALITNDQSLVGAMSSAYGAPVRAAAANDSPPNVANLAGSGSGGGQWQPVETNAGLTTSIIGGAGDSPFATYDLGPGSMTELLNQLNAGSAQFTSSPAALGFANTGFSPSLMATVVDATDSHGSNAFVTPSASDLGLTAGEYQQTGLSGYDGGLVL